MTPTAEFLLRNTNGGEAGNRTTRRMPKRLLVTLILAVLEQVWHLNNFWLLQFGGWLCVGTFFCTCYGEIFPIERIYDVYATKKGDLKDPLKKCTDYPNMWAQINKNKIPV